MVQVQQAKHWKNKDTSKIKDFKEIEYCSDWTYTTPYKGTVRYLSQATKHIKDVTSLELTANKDASNVLVLKETPDEKISFEMLGPENPIVHFGEVYLFECDLDDCGYVQSKVRFRVMNDCFYILLRFYLRVDGVLVRIFDTRVFHKYGSDHIHREFQHKENTWEELRKKKFDLSSEWMLNPLQSDMIFGTLEGRQVV